MGKRWQIQQHDAGRIAELERRAGVSPVVAQLLVARGIEDAAVIGEFLDPKLSALRDPELLPGLTDAADRVHAAIQSGNRIVVYGDYDADGMCATAILFRCLSMLGADVGYHVPSRMEEGYGLNHDALRSLAERGAQMVITVDCGIASVDEAVTALEVGLELVITDHHEMKAELPRAAALVHPRLPGHSYPFGGLCGAGVAFKLAWALCQRASQSKKVGDRMRGFLLTALGLAAMATIADVVPLLDENRIIVRHGLFSLKNQPVLGLQSLMRITKVIDKPALASEDVAFMLAPRLNAAGRLGQAQLGIELLVTDSTERADSLAEYIDELNGSRDSLERKIYLAATKQIAEMFDSENDPALVLAGRGWHQGVIGIVAGRLAEKYHRPVVMIAQDDLGTKPATGSARSASGLALHEALAACGDHLVGHGGHAAAAGLRIEDARIDDFRADFCEYVACEVAPQDRVAEVRIDVEAPLSQLTLRTVQEIERLAPFGQANPRPVLCATGVTLPESPRRMGKSERHLSLRLKQHNVTLRAVAFGQGDWADELDQQPGAIDIAYRPVINEFRGRRNVELHLVDWRPCGVTSVVEG